MTRERERERKSVKERKSECEKRKSEIHGEERRKDYNLSLRDKKKVLSRQLCTIVLLLACPSILCFLPHADHFCIEIPFLLLLLLLLPPPHTPSLRSSSIRFTPVFSRLPPSLLRGQSMIPLSRSNRHYLRLVEIDSHHEINILTLRTPIPPPFPFLLDDVIDEYLFKESLE